MSKRSRTNVLFLLCMCLTQLGHAQQNEPTSDLQGSLVGGNVYVNAALGMTITLPGTWELGRAVPTQSKPPSDCSGPLCGNPEINLILRTKSDSTPAARVRLAGYKLSGPYLNRSRQSGAPRNFAIRQFLQSLWEGFHFPTLILHQLFTTSDESIFGRASVHFLTNQLRNGLRNYGPTSQKSDSILLAEGTIGSERLKFGALAVFSYYVPHCLLHKRHKFAINLKGPITQLPFLSGIHTHVFQIIPKRRLIAEASHQNGV